MEFSIVFVVFALLLSIFCSFGTADLLTPHHLHVASGPKVDKLELAKERREARDMLRREMKSDDDDDDEEEEDDDEDDDGSSSNGGSFLSSLGNTAPENILAGGIIADFAIAGVVIVFAKAGKIQETVFGKYQ